VPIKGEKKLYTEEERKTLFTEQLPKWERFIYTKAKELISTRVIDRGLYGVEDIQQILRVSLWHAINKYDESENRSLSSWIIGLLKQQCSLLVEKQYNAVPRAEDSSPLFPEPLYYQTEAGEVAREFKDVSSEDRFEEMINGEWLEKLLAAVKPLLKQRKRYHEEEIWTRMLSGMYQSDYEIAEELNINFAKVSAARTKLKLVYCMLTGIPVEKVSKAIDIDILYRQLRHSFQSTRKNSGLSLVSR